MKTLEVSNLCKTYIIKKRQNNVLRNVNLTIHEGEMLGIMGPSGSGKTTLLYTVSGMDTATAGKVDFFGRELTSLKAGDMSDVRLNEMGFVFQQMYMLKNLSVYDNIILPGYQTAEGKTKSGRRQLNERAKLLMHKLGISEIAENDVNEVSGGQLQRACICRSMINNPKMIFADEPTGALNRKSSDEVMNELLSLNRDGTTVMCVTHDPKVAAKCSRVLYIVDGGIMGEKEMGHFDDGKKELRDRERELNNWLMEQGW